MKRSEVYKLIDGERDYQERMWGSGESKGLHSPCEFLVYMQDYLTQAMNQATRIADPASRIEVLKTIRKITAMGIACMEQHDTQARE